MDFLLKCFTVCVESVAAFACSLIKFGLQQMGDGFDGRLCTGIVHDTSRLERVFIVLEVSGSACLSREEEALLLTLARWMLHPEDRRSGAGDAGDRSGGFLSVRRRAVFVFVRFA